MSSAIRNVADCLGLPERPKISNACVPNVTNYRRKGLKFLSEIENGGKHAHPHRLHDCAYGCNRTRGLLFSRLAPAGRDHTAAEVVCAASPYFPATNSRQMATPVENFSTGVFPFCDLIGSTKLKGVSLNGLGDGFLDRITNSGPLDPLTA